ncbi:hypothetical protein MASR2M50_21150 [Thauera sp.]
MKTEHAPTIQRADYRPLAWTVETVDLHFRLDPEATLVTNRMCCVRNRDAADGPIRLWSEALERVSLSVDGQAPQALREDGGVIEIDAAGDRVVVEVVTRVNPRANTTLSGLYLSNGGFFTQCEAEGFRRITCFPDRPDVMARYTVTLEADRDGLPGAALQRQPGRRRAAARGPPLREVGGSLPQAFVSVRAGRGEAGRARAPRHHDVGPRGAAAGVGGSG